MIESIKKEPPEHELQRVHRQLTRIMAVLGRWNAMIGQLDAMRGICHVAGANDLAAIFQKTTTLLERHPEFLEMVSVRIALEERGQRLSEQINSAQEPLQPSAPAWAALDLGSKEFGAGFSLPPSADDDDDDDDHGLN